MGESIWVISMHAIEALFMLAMRFARHYRINRFNRESQFHGRHLGIIAHT